MNTINKMNIKETLLLIEKINNKDIDLGTLHLCIVEDQKMFPVISVQEHAESEFYTSLQDIEEQFDGVVYWDGEEYYCISLAVFILKLKINFCEKNIQEVKEDNLDVLSKKTQKFLAGKGINSISQLRGNYLFFYEIKNHKIVFRSLLIT